ncbi:MAG: RidA family protein [Alphaproteobacteria bacterium]|nr:RidA family protein [Alphaproteobacteria bacterium]MCB9930698.1 RidA family protein [Alphaproteobacteria bacterium]
MNAVENPRGGYLYLPAGYPFSSGTAALPGYEVVNAVFRRPVPWREGFAVVDRHLTAAGRPKQALCGVELRCPKPMTPDGFHEFNTGYRAILEDWDIIVDGVNPVGRTNVSPVVNPPSETLMYGFSYTVENADIPRTFCGAGGGETTADGVVREGDTSPDGMREKTARVMAIMEARLAGLGMQWSDVTTVNVYTAVTDAGWLAPQLLSRMGPDAVHGIHWHLSRPPIIGLDFEMDLRGTRTKLWL